MKDPRRKTILKGGTWGRYLPSGHLVYVNGGALFAAGFDLDRMEVRSTPVAILGRFLWTPVNHFPHVRAIQEFRHALALNWNSADGHLQLANIYTHIGLLDKALEEVRTAAATDPSAAETVIQEAHILAFQGKYEEALAVYRTIPRTSFPTVLATHNAWALFQIGRRLEASAMIDESSRNLLK